MGYNAVLSWLPSTFQKCKVNGYTFRGSNSVIFIVASHINWGHIIKERLCSHWSKFIPLRVDPILGRLCPSGKQTGSHENCLPLKTVEKDRGIPIHLKTNLMFCCLISPYHRRRKREGGGPGPPPII